MWAHEVKQPHLRGVLYNFAAGGQACGVYLCGESRFVLENKGLKVFSLLENNVFEKCPFCSIRNSERRVGRKPLTIFFVAAYKIEAQLMKIISRLEVYPTSQYTK